MKSLLKEFWEDILNWLVVDYVVLMEVRGFTMFSSLFVGEFWYDRQKHEVCAGRPSTPMTYNQARKISKMPFARIRDCDYFTTVEVVRTHIMRVADAEFYEKIKDL